MSHGIFAIGVSNGTINSTGFATKTLLQRKCLVISRMVESVVKCLLVD